MMILTTYVITNEEFRLFHRSESESPLVSWTHAMKSEWTCSRFKANSRRPLNSRRIISLLHSSTADRTLFSLFYKSSKENQQFNTLIHPASYKFLPSPWQELLCSAELQSSIQAMEIGCYRKVLRISYKNHVTDEAVRTKIQQATGPHEDLLTNVKRCKL